MSIAYKFRKELINRQNEFKKVFEDLLNSNEIQEFPDYLWDIIRRDRTSIRINKEPLAFKDLFNQDLTEGRCMSCVFEFLLLLDKFGIYSEAVKCENEYFKGTTGSTYGGHWYLQAIIENKIICIDTSLVVIGSEETFRKLGHKIIKKYDIDTLFKEHPELIDYYDEMIINKTNL